jgi:hypothetical protein
LIIDNKDQEVSLLAFVAVSYLLVNRGVGGTATVSADLIIEIGFAWRLEFFKFMCIATGKGDGLFADN